MCRLETCLELSQELEPGLDCLTLQQVEMTGEANDPCAIDQECVWDSRHAIHVHGRLVDGIDLPKHDELGVAALIEILNLSLKVAIDRKRNDDHALAAVASPQLFQVRQGSLAGATRTLLGVFRSVRWKAEPQAQWLQEQRTHRLRSLLALAAELRSRGPL